MRPIASYLELIREFPIRPIRSAAQHRQAVRVLTRVSMENQGSRDTGVRDYMQALARFVDDFERAAAYDPDLSSLTPQTAIKHLMDVHDLNVTEMADTMGTTQGTLSEILRERRGVSKEMIRRLIDRFGVDARVFL